MQTYSVHVRRSGLDPDRDVVLVKEGFSWLALFFSFLWAAWNRLWTVSIGIILVMSLSGAITGFLNLNPGLTGLIHLGMGVLIGFVAFDLQRYTLTQAGFEQVDLVVAESKQNAERQFYDNNPALAATIAEGLED